MASDPFQPWDQSNGKGKAAPPVPEPSVTGATLAGAALLVVAVVKWRAARRNRLTHSI